MRFAKLKVFIDAQPGCWDYFLPTDIKRFIERPAEPEKTTVAILVTADPSEYPSTNYQRAWVHLDMTIGEVVAELNSALTDDMLDTSFLDRPSARIPMPVDLEDGQDEEPVEIPEEFLDSK